MSKHIPPHLRNSEQNVVKHVHFQQDQVVQSWINSLKESKKENKKLKSENEELRKENEELINGNAELITGNKKMKKENTTLRKENEKLNKHVNQLNEEVALYKGNQEERVPKSSFDELRKEFEEIMMKKQEIDENYRIETDSLRTEINILKEELKKSEKRITHLSSNVTSLSQTNEQLKQIIESLNSSQNHIEEPKKEENSELISDDWHNIKTSLKYLLNDQKLRKQFVKETGINLTGMKLTMEIIEKLGL